MEKLGITNNTMKVLLFLCSCFFISQPLLGCLDAEYECGYKDHKTGQTYQDQNSPPITFTANCCSKSGRCQLCDDQETKLFAKHCNGQTVFTSIGYEYSNTIVPAKGGLSGCRWGR